MTTTPFYNDPAFSDPVRELRNALNAIATRRTEQASAKAQQADGAVIEVLDGSLSDSRVLRRWVMDGSDLILGDTLTAEIDKQELAGVSKHLTDISLLDKADVDPLDIDDLATDICRHAEQVPEFWEVLATQLPHASESLKSFSRTLSSHRQTLRPQSAEQVAAI